MEKLGLRSLNALMGCSQALSGVTFEKVAEAIAVVAALPLLGTDKLPPLQPAPAIGSRHLLTATTPLFRVTAMS